jgi:hypothetical protein
LRNISTPVTTVLVVAFRPDDLDLLADLHDAALDAARHHRAAARDREHVLDRHQERLVLVARRLRDVAVDLRHQLQIDCSPCSGVLVLQRHQRRAAHHRDVVARELVALQKLANLELDQVQKLGSSTMSTLFMYTTSAGTPTWRASRMCSRVCGIGPSAADTTRIAPSICAAP